MRKPWVRGLIKGDFKIKKLESFRLKILEKKPQKKRIWIGDLREEISNKKPN